MIFASNMGRTDQRKAEYLAELRGCAAERPRNRQQSMICRESTLDCPAVYRRFLAGGLQPLRLSFRAGGVIVAVGILIATVAGLRSVWLDDTGLGVTASCFSTVGWPTLTVVIQTVHALLLAALSARWLGSRMGTLVGVVYLTSFHVLLLDLSAIGHWTLSSHLACVALTAAMGAFAVGNIAGRLPLIDCRVTRSVFYAAAGVACLLGGPTAPLVIFSTCLVSAAVGADSRAMRFLADAKAVALFLLLIGIQVATSVPETDTNAEITGAVSVARDTSGWSADLEAHYGRLLWDSLPWMPLAVGAILGGLRQGHYATPIWRLFGCWAAGVSVLAFVGILPPQLSDAIVAPLSALGAGGLLTLLAWRRRQEPTWRFATTAASRSLDQSPRAESAYRYC